MWAWGVWWGYGGGGRIYVSQKSHLEPPRTRRCNLADAADRCKVSWRNLQFLEFALRGEGRPPEGMR